MNSGNRTFTEILGIFNQKEIKYSLLRIPNDAILINETELDVLIWPESLKQADTILRQNKFVLWKDRTFLKKRVYARYYEKTLWLIDMHLAFVQDGLTYMDLKGVEERLNVNKFGFKILAKEDQLLHYFFHNLLGKGHLQTKHLDSVQGLISSEIDKTYLFSKFKDQAIKKIFRQFVKNPSEFCHTNEKTSKKITILKKRILKQSFGNRFRFYFKKYLFKTIYKNRGVHFAILGVDGAGKSSLIDALEHNLASIKGVKYNVIYMGPWGHSKSPWHKWILKKQITLPKNTDKSKAKAKKYKSFVKGTIYYLSVYFELWYRYLKFVRPGLKKGLIVLSDRYIYDLRYLYKKRAVTGFRFIRFFICCFFPKPDKIVFLYNDPDIIVKRKPQLNAEQIRIYQEYYSKALDKYKPISIETNDDVFTIGEQVLNEIFNDLLKISVKN